MDMGEAVISVEYWRKQSSKYSEFSSAESLQSPIG